MPGAERRSQWKIPGDLQFDLAIDRRNQHQGVAHHIVPRGSLDQLAALQIVHPLGIRREKHVGTGAGFDLARQRGTRCE